MKTIDIMTVRHESIQDAYHTCKYLERKGIEITEVTIGNVHDSIEDAVDENQLPITQVVSDCSIGTDRGIMTDHIVEGYIIREA